MITKDILLVLTYLVGAGELALAIFFWVTRSGNEIRKVMALLSLSTSIWVVFSGLTSYVVQNPVTTIYMKIVFAAGIFLVTALLHLTLVWPFQVTRLDKLHGWLLYAPAVLFSVISFVSNTIVVGFTGSPTDSGRILPGPLYNAYNICVFGIYLVAVILLFARQRKMDGIHRKNLRLIFWSVVIGGMPAVIIDLIIPIVTVGVYPNANYGAISTIAWLGATTYIVLKR